ncbi:unnamed protein product, partial [Ectocarpus sp. 8 AP-2014]
MRLFLVCAVTHRLVPCGPDGQGYDIQRPRSWFRMSTAEGQGYSSLREFIHGVEDTAQLENAKAT